jgi:hypothetical protein
MLTELTNNIEKALISYMKNLEGDRLQDQYAQGLLGIVIQCRSVSDERKRDIHALYAICQSALQAFEEPEACIKRLVDYLNLIHSGFFFFRGQSKLKNNIIAAINIYDPRYIANAKDHPIQLDMNARSRPIQVGLTPSLMPPVRVDDQVTINPAIQQQFDDMRQALQQQREENVTQTLLIQELRDSLRNMGRVVEMKERAMTHLEGELLQLRGELAQVNQRSRSREAGDAAPVRGSASVNDIPVSEQRRMSFVQ